MHNSNSHSWSSIQAINSGRISIWERLKNSNKMDGIYKNIQEYNSNKKTFLIVFDDIVADILNNKKLNSIVTELSIRGRKLNISLVFILQSCFAVPINY